MKPCKVIVTFLIFVIFIQLPLENAEALKENDQRQILASKKIKVEARSKFVDELCECAVAAKITGVLAIQFDDIKTQKMSSLRVNEFLSAAKEVMSPKYIEARYKSMLVKFLDPNKLNDDYANKFIRERAHMCGYIIQNKYERLQYWNDIIAKQ